MRRYERIAQSYWQVGHAVRHPAAPPISTETALKVLNASDRLRPDEHKLRDQMHILRYDIIEGNDKWREKRVVHGSRLIQLTRD